MRLPSIFFILLNIGLIKMRKGYSTKIDDKIIRAFVEKCREEEMS